MRKKIPFTFIISLLINNLVFSQTVLTDSLSTEAAFQNTIDLYYSAIGENAHLYNGSENIGYNTTVIGHPYLHTTEMEAGSLYYDGTLYKNIPFLYDIFNDELIINKYNQNYKITLASEKISYFSYASGTYIRIVPDSADKVLAGIGFYNRIYNGKTTVLIKRKKTIREDAVTTGVATSRFIQQNTYFVKRGNSYSRVSSKKSLIKLFNEQSKEIRKYLKKNKIDFKSQPEYAIVEAARYYDLLTN